MDYEIKTAEQLSLLVADARKLKSLKQSDLAYILSTTQQSYARIEGNIGSTKVETLLTILSSLELELVIRPSASFHEVSPSKNTQHKAIPIRAIGSGIDSSHRIQRSADQSLQLHDSKLPGENGKLIAASTTTNDDENDTTTIAASSIKSPDRLIVLSSQSTANQDPSKKTSW